MLLQFLKQNKLFRFLASLKLAVVLLILLAAILAAATFYESIYDTKTAQHLVYHSTFFALFLTMLGVNLGASMVTRYPWRKALAGFVVTHIGIIVLLIGALVTMAFGVDGSMSLAEGEKGNKITIDEPVIYFGRELNKISEIPAEYRWKRPKPGGTTYRYQLDQQDGIAAVIDDYYHHAQGDPLYVPSPDGIPALQLRLSNTAVDQKLWLTTADGKVTMGLAQLELFRLPDLKAVEAFKKPAAKATRGTLQILIKDNPLVVDLDRLGSEPYQLELAGYSLRLLRYLPYAVVEGDKLISRSDEPINPAVEIELTSESGSQTWLLFAALPELNTRTKSKGEPAEARLIFSKPEQSQGRSFEVGITPKMELLYRIDGKICGSLTDAPVQTSWMNLRIEKLKFVAKAKRETEFREVFPKKGTEDKAPGPAIRVTIEGSKDPKPFWLQRGDIKRIRDAKGKEIIVGYGYKTVPLGFDITLKKFHMGYDPGTHVAASYNSDIVVDNVEHRVAMNEPFEKNGFRVYQSSYGETPDGQQFSVFSIGRDPGIWLKLLGSLMLVLGCILQFYFKPKKARADKSAEPNQEAPLD